jgi:NAD-dependent deacetylase
MGKAMQWVSEADVFVCAGTSLNVYPAAGLIYHLSDSCRKYIVDPDVDNMDFPYDFNPWKGNAATAIPALAIQLMNEQSEQ